jgi:hypothetical protein
MVDRMPSKPEGEGEEQDEHCLFGEVCEGCGRGDEPALDGC